MIEHGKSGKGGTTKTATGAPASPTLPRKTSARHTRTATGAEVVKRAPLEKHIAEVSDAINVRAAVETHREAMIKFNLTDEKVQRFDAQIELGKKVEAEGGVLSLDALRVTLKDRFGDYRTSADLACFDMDMNFDAKLAKTLQAGGAFPDNDADLDRALGLVEGPIADHAETLAESGFDKEQQAELLATAAQFHDALAARPAEKEALNKLVDERQKVLKRLRNNTRYMRNVGRGATKRIAARADFDRQSSQSDVHAMEKAAKQAGAKVKRTGAKLASQTKEAEERAASAEAARVRREARKKKGKARKR